jgi:hypothetical protein
MSWWAQLHPNRRNSQKPRNSGELLQVQLHKLGHKGLTALRAFTLSWLWLLWLENRVPIQATAMQLWAVASWEMRLLKCQWSSANTCCIFGFHHKSLGSRQCIEVIEDSSKEALLAHLDILCNAEGWDHHLLICSFIHVFIISLSLSLSLSSHRHLNYARLYSSVSCHLSNKWYIND